MEKYYTTSDIARMFKVKTITVRRWIEKKHLTAYKLGKELRIKQIDLDSFLKERRTT